MLQFCLVSGWRCLPILFLVFASRKEDPLKESDSSTLEDIFSKNKKKGLFDDDDDDDLFAPSSSSKPESSTDIENMGQEDILKYIQSNN